MKELLRGVPGGMFFPRGTEILSAAGLAFPLVAKVVSSRIASKSDIGGVRLGIGNGGELQAAVSELSRMEHAERVLVEEMARPGFEVIVGGQSRNAAIAASRKSLAGAMSWSEELKVLYFSHQYTAPPSTQRGNLPQADSTPVDTL